MRTILAHLRSSLKDDSDPLVHWLVATVIGLSIARFAILNAAHKYNEETMSYEMLALIPSVIMAMGGAISSLKYATKTAVLTTLGDLEKRDIT